MDMEIMQPTEASVLRLEGSWTIERANELKQSLVRLITDSEAVVLNVEELTEVDLSCLQVLCAAHRTSLNLGRKLTLHEGKQEKFRQAARTAGFSRTLGCHNNPSENCLWIGGLES